MKWAPLGLVFLLAFLVPVDADQTYLNLGDCNNSDPGVEALAANGDAMFVGRRDGYIRAIDRDNGRLIWEYPSAYQPDAGVKSIVIDDGTLYAAYSEATNDFVDPVIALDLATGEEVWRQTALDTTDVFRLLLADNVLYAGLNGGSVIAMNPATGKALTSGGNMVRFDPVSFDGTTQPNGIYALEAAGDYIYAARNFGYVTDTGPAIPVNLTHENNTILVLQKGSLAPVGAGTVNAGEYKLQDTDGDTVNDAIFGFATDGTNVYTAGSGFRPVEDNRGRNRVLTLATIGRFPISDTQIQWDLKRYTGDQDLDIGNDNDPDNWANGIFSATDIGYDGSHVYAVTQQGFDIIGGNLLKLDPVSLSPVEWSAPRNFAARDMLSLWVGDGPEDLVVGHACMHASGGLSRAIVSQVQKTEAPSVLLLKPTRGEESDGTIDIELIGYHSNPSVTELTAQFFVSEVGGNCNDGISCYSAIHVPNAIVPVPGFASFNDIPIEVPDGNQIRLRVQVTDPFGNVAVDFAELDFVVDRVAPTGLSITPSASSLVQTAKPLLRVTYADDRAGVEGDDVRLLIGGKNANQNRVYEASGFSVTLGDGNPRLQEGINHVQLVVPDRSGNQAVISQSLILDSIVKTPSLRPTDEGWVQSVREPITAQFSEDVFPTSATFDGVDVLNRLEVVEQAVGTLITYRPTTDHPSGRDAVFELFVEDEAGNHGGPYKTRFRADPDAPLIGSRSPAEGDLLTGDRPLIKFNLRDSGSGLDEDTLSVFVDGEDVTRQVERNLDQFSWEPTSPFKSGTHQVTVSVSDVARNIASTTWNFRVDLDAPSMEASVELPTGQTAVKRGDEVTFTVQVTDQSQLRSVRADLSTISPGRSAAEPMQAVPGFAGRYQLTVPVQDANTHEVAV
ncbi:MAG: Ig-like domain-containing protein, partial [Thermoplasmatota archaeon]